jgi:hypothetical protein
LVAIGPEEKTSRFCDRWFGLPSNFKERLRDRGLIFISDCKREAQHHLMRKLVLPAAAVYETFTMHHLRHGQSDLEVGYRGNTKVLRFP